jgi:hypothetical protein
MAHRKPGKVFRIEHIFQHLKKQKTFLPGKDDVKQVRTVRAGKDGCIAVPQVADVGNLHPFINLKPMA